MIERDFDIKFTASLALREKQIQQSYRPIIGVHKWFARRPGTVFRSLLLAEFGDEPVRKAFWKGHNQRGVIADPFMGGGTPIYEATRLGFDVVGTDVNPMAYWIVRQSLAPLEVSAFLHAAESVIADVEQDVAAFYETACLECGSLAQVKYFLWVKVENCPSCGTENNLFPGYELARPGRHPRHVVACGSCGALNEFESRPTAGNPGACTDCGGTVFVEGPASRGRARCQHCAQEFAYPSDPSTPPRHRLWAIEYHCKACKPTRKGRFFKKPDGNDLIRIEKAESRCKLLMDELPIPSDPIPSGDETNRLHRWGYHYYREMFNARQLLGLGLLLRRITAVPQVEVRHALLTVYSDFLRYQNMLCRYDIQALKCQDIFSVHGFPVGLVQCENNLLGIASVGSGAFRHFVDKYRKAKEYGERPFETIYANGRKSKVWTTGERIGASLTSGFPSGDDRQGAWLLAAPATDMSLPPESLNGVFTDPPYFDNVQYAELMDFCYVWLRQALRGEVKGFDNESTRTDSELTGNVTRGRGLEHFTAGLSDVFSHYAAALIPGAPFVFTYHHNDPEAYVPLVVAILDASLNCTATLPAPAEMGASLHINGTGSSIIDTIFVCRHGNAQTWKRLESELERDLAGLRLGGVKVTEGDLKCLAAGHLARMAVNKLHNKWDPARPVSKKIIQASVLLRSIASADFVHAVISRVLAKPTVDNASPTLFEASV